MFDQEHLAVQEKESSGAQPMPASETVGQAGKRKKNALPEIVNLGIEYGQAGRTLAVR